MNGYTNQYLANQIASASPEQLLLMLYDGAIRFTNLAMQAIADDDIPKRSYYINRASAIIAELDATLDHGQDAALAENLDALYHFMLKEFMNANKDHDQDPLKIVVKMLKELRETWAKAVALNKQDHVAALSQSDKPAASAEQPTIAVAL